jgi:hypothetical protein
MTITLKAHSVWQNVSQALEHIDPDEIARSHLIACDFEIQGYWDEDDRPYESIRFTTAPQPELISRSLGMNSSAASRWLQLKYELTIADSGSKESIGELLLVLNEDLEVVDENWVIDLRSPYVVAVAE